MMTGTVPPSALHAAPVTYDDRSEHRKTITAAISSGVPSRPSGRPADDLCEHRLAVALLVGQATVADPRLAGGGSRRDRVAAHPVLRVHVRHQPRERQQPGLHHGVLGQRRGRPLAGGRRHVDDRASPALDEQRQHRACGSDRAHQVQLERSLPVRVRQLGQRANRRPADVVDEAVHLPEARVRSRHEPFRLAGRGEVGRDMELADSIGSTSGGDDARALRLQLPGDLEPDPAGRAGDDADFSGETEFHRGATLAA